MLLLASAARRMRTLQSARGGGESQKAGGDPDLFSASAFFREREREGTLALLQVLTLNHWVSFY